MRVVFMGTPEAAVPSLHAVADAYDVVAVYTQPDRPKGRGRRAAPSPVKVAAQHLGVEVVEPASLRAPEEVERLRTYGPDAVAVVAFGQILTPAILEVPALGCVNVHFSLLPRWRGAAPVARAILAGDRVTGVTTMLMDPGLDTGPVLLTASEPIRDDDTGGDLTARLATLGAALLVRTLDGLSADTLTPRPQPDEGATYAKKIEAAEGELDLSEPAEDLARRVRALYPHPGTHTSFRGKRLKVWSAVSEAGDGIPGEIVEAAGPGVVVACGRGRLRLLEVQPEGKRRMSGEEFARGYRPAPGESLGTAGG